MRLVTSFATRDEDIDRFPSHRRRRPPDRWPPSRTAGRQPCCCRRCAVDVPRKPLEILLKHGRPEIAVLLAERLHRGSWGRRREFVRHSLLMAVAAAAITAGPGSGLRQSAGGRTLGCTRGRSPACPVLGRLGPPARLRLWTMEPPVYRRRYVEPKSRDRFPAAEAIAVPGRWGIARSAVRASPAASGSSRRWAARATRQGDHPCLFGGADQHPRAGARRPALPDAAGMARREAELRARRLVAHTPPIREGRIDPDGLDRPRGRPHVQPRASSPVPCRCRRRVRTSTAA